MKYHKLCRNEYYYETEAVKPNQKFDRDRLASPPPMHSLAAPKGERLSKPFFIWPLKSINEKMPVVGCIKHSVVGYRLDEC